MNLKDRVYHIFSIRWIQHLSFWTVFLLMELGRFIDLDEERLINEISFEGTQLFFIVFLVYFNLRVLIPKYWNTGKYSKYIISIITIEITTISILSTILYNFPEIEFKHFASKSIGKMIMMNTFKTNIFVLSSSLFHFVKEWIALKDENLRFTENAQKQLAAELSLLKAQVNPHFLFNTLNNIYSMSLYDSNKTPEMILKLSQLISYMLYECKDEEVNLEKEIQFIRNYIELEALRVEDTADIKLNIYGENQVYKIPPLLFIPLIENAFKHGISNEIEKSEIRIDLKFSKDKIILEITNPLDYYETTSKKHSGLGIENVRKRLNLLYPHNHSFTVLQNNKTYKTIVSITLNNSNEN
nr:histidine kinase [uncultured Marinifilum sp.]